MANRLDVSPDDFRHVVVAGEFADELHPLSRAAGYLTPSRPIGHTQSIRKLHVCVTYFQISRRDDKFPNMRFVLAIRRLFLLAAMLAIVVGPMSIGLAGSAMASSGVATMEGMIGTMTDMQMTQDMPCCPKEQPVKPDCVKGCQLALVCTSSIVAHAPTGVASSFAISWLSHRYDLFPASQLTSALREPPARPPKA